MLSQRDVAAVEDLAAKLEACERALAAERDERRRIIATVRKERRAAAAIHERAERAQAQAHQSLLQLADLERRLERARRPLWRKLLRRPPRSL